MQRVCLKLEAHVLRPSLEGPNLAILGVMFHGFNDITLQNKLWRNQLSMCARVLKRGRKGGH
eukprot:1159482-Pelagomonas_calceolata.AAC.7